MPIPDAPMLRALRQTITRLLGKAPDRSVPGILLPGGGARSAYQAGVIRYVAEAFPEAYFPI